MCARVLLIDDDETLGAVVAEVLTDEGFTVARAVSRQQARDQLALASEPFDLVLSDSFRPVGMSPYIWLDELKTLTSASVMILSGWQAEAFADWQERGFVAVLLKPFDLDELLTVVKRVVAAPPC